MTLNLKKHIFLYTLLLQTFSLWAQYEYLFTHYSTSDGLSQNTVKQILQARNGMMWFSTWDGLNRFDGYAFKVYKGDDKIALSNNRIEQLSEDSYGYLWIRDFNEHIYRFDPICEHFDAIESPDSDSYSCSKLYITPGETWAVTEKAEIIRINTDTATFKLNTNLYSRRDGFIANQIYGVFSDTEGGNWILTDIGIYLSRSKNQPPQFQYIGDSGTFYSAAEDKCGNSWFSGQNGLISIYDKKKDAFSKLQLPSTSPLNNIILSHNGQMCVSSLTDGFFLIDTATKKTEHYHTNNLPGLTSNNIQNVYLDSKDGLWLDLHGSVIARFDIRTKQIESYQLSVEQSLSSASNTDFIIFEDVHGFLWIQPSGGGFSLYDWDKKTLKPFFNKEQSADNKYSSKLHAAFSDKQGNLWLSTHTKGLEKISFSKKNFLLQPIRDISDETIQNNVRSLYLDSDRYLWVGTRGGRLHVYNHNMCYMGYLTQQGQVSKIGHPLDVSVYCMIEDSRGDFWIGTRGQGLYHAKRTTSTMHYKMRQYIHNERDKYSISCDNIYAIHEDRHNNIWVGTFDRGLNLTLNKDRLSGRFINMDNELKHYPVEAMRIRCISTDSEGNLLIGTTSGIIIINSYFSDPKDIVYRNFAHTIGDENALSNNDVIDICTTKSGDIFCVTMGGGLNKIVHEGSDKCSFRKFGRKEGLASDVLVSVKEDFSGKLWIASENELCKFDPRTYRAETYVDIVSQSSILLNESTVIQTNNGKMIFGTDKGLISFYPDSISKSAFIPNIIFTNFTSIDGKSLPITLDNLNVDGQKRELKNLTLTYKQSSFTIGFAALDYCGSKNIKYAYRLKDIDDEWRQIDNQHSVNYVSLPKGDYQFQVKSTNSDGVWADNIQSLCLTIKPAPWQTPLAYACYIVAVILFIIIVTRVLFVILRLKHKVKVEKQMADIKLDFFTDISHELRTPLSLITAPVESLLGQKEIQGKTRAYLSIIETNTNRMLNLINQLLDFRKLQEKKMRIQVEQVNVVNLVKKVMENFNIIAVEHQINYSLLCDEEYIPLWIDVDKVEKTIFNLLSNSFKYTDRQGKITVIIEQSDKTVDIRIDDTGIGIEPNKIDTLFNRFENQSNKNPSNQPSTGIGLSIVKQLAKLHNATVSVSSVINKGSSFTITFLKGKLHFGDEDFMTSDVLHESVSAKDACCKSSMKTMLIVEDNADFRNFLASVFANQYHIIEAENGDIGIKAALEHIPDIIISDLMMPVKDGAELVRSLRNNVNTSYIPLIILTAKNAMEQKLESLEYGADDYIIKPFSTKYLEARVKNLLAVREKMYRHYYNHSDINSDITEEGLCHDFPYTNLSETDLCFINDLTKYIRQHISEKLLIDDLAIEFKMSRSAFFKKLKVMTNLSPIEFVIDLRLKAAIELIKSGSFNISEIAFRVGIDDPKYFSRIFKQKYKISPRSFRETAQN